MRTLNTIPFLAVSCLCLCLGSLRADTESNLEKSFDVSPGGNLSVDADIGSIQVRTADTGKVNIRVLRQTEASEKDAGKLFAAHKVTFEEKSGRVSVLARLDEGAKSFFRRNQHLKVRFEIEIPRKFDVNLRSASGSIQVADLDGTAALDSMSGSLTLGKISGEIKAKTASGSVRVDAAGSKAHIESASGSLEVREAAGDLRATTASGSVRVGSAGGAAFLRSMSGSIHLDHAAASVDAETASGSVTAALTKQPAADCHLESQSGSVEVRIPEGLNLDVEARTLAGRVRSEIPIQATILGDQPRGEVKGKIGAGGPRLHLRTASGNVDIRKL